MEILGFIIGFVIGLIIAISSTLFITTSSGWSKWESLGVTYSVYDWYLIQRRTKSNGKIQFRKIKIQKYGTLSDEIISKILNK